MAQKQDSSSAIFALSNTFANSNLYMCITFFAIATFSGYILHYIINNNKLSLYQMKKVNEIDKSITLTNSMKNLGLNSLDANHVIKFKQSFYKTIEHPIQIIQELCYTNLPQKCLLHNNNYTLYCQQDNKPLCANCVYKNSKHKAHKVFPIKNCTQNLRRDSSMLQSNLIKMVQEIYELIRHVNNGVLAMDKQFPQTIKNIEQRYVSLHQIITIKQQEHKNQIKFYKQKVKYQFAILSAELRKTAVYIEEKLNQYSKFTKQEELLTRKNVLDTLNLSSRLIQNQINNNININEKYTLNFQIFDQIENFIDEVCPHLFSRPSNPNTRTKNKYNRSIDRHKLSTKTKTVEERSVSNKKNNKNQSPLKKSPSTTYRREDRSKQTHNKKKMEILNNLSNQKKRNNSKSINKAKTPPKK